MTQTTSAADRGAPGLAAAHYVWSHRKAALAAYAQTQVSYRQLVLSAFALVADYSAGTVGYLQILLADSQFHQTRIARLQGVAQRLQDTVALYAALGGGSDNARRAQVTR